MKDTAAPVSQTESRVGGLSLICLALGIVGPFFSALALGVLKVSQARGVDPIAVAAGIRVAFVLLALVLGILSRRTRMGRLGLMGSAVLLSIVLVLVGFLFSRHTVAPVSIPNPRPPA